MIMDIATEEIGHVEMIATMVARLLETSPVEAEKAAEDGGVVGAVPGGDDTQQAIVNAAMNPQHAIVSGGGATPNDSQGFPWNSRYTIASGNLLADIRFNVTAESQGRLQVTRLYQLTEDSGVRDMFSFLLARGNMHQNQWLAAIEELAADGLEENPVPSNFPVEREMGEVAYKFMNFSEGEESAQVRWARGLPWTARGSSSTWQSLRRWAPRWTSWPRRSSRACTRPPSSRCSPPLLDEIPCLRSRRGRIRLRSARALPERK
jgi:Mn-containing catalase